MCRFVRWNAKHGGAQGNLWRRRKACGGDGSSSSRGSGGSNSGNGQVGGEMGRYFRVDAMMVGRGEVDGLVDFGRGAGAARISAR